MAALGWYQESSPGRWPEDAPPSVWSGSYGLWEDLDLRGGVIGVANGPVTWTFLWNGTTELPYVIGHQTTDSQVTVKLQHLYTAPYPPPGILQVMAADLDGALDGVLRLAVSSGGGAYGSVTWDVINLTPPTPPEFWTEFISSYEVP